MDGEEHKYHGSGAIPALADEEFMGEDDEYDDLYSDVNVGEGFLQMHQAQAPIQPGGAGHGGLQTQKNDAPETRVAPSGPAGSNMPKVSGDGNYLNRPEIGSGTYPEAPKGIGRDAQARNVGYQGAQAGPTTIGDPPDVPRRTAHEPPPLPNPTPAGPRGVQQMQPNQVSVNPNVNHPMVNQNHIQPLVDNGNTMILVGELHWWTTDAELENVCSQYGRVKEIKFFDERASGKSKGYCQVEFYEAAAAAACKEGMHGHLFNGRACVVAFASPETIKQMGASYTSRNQGQGQSQSRRSMNDGMGRGGNVNMQGGDGGRNFGRGGFGRGGQGNRGPWAGGQMRGRVGPPGAKNMVGNGVGGGPYGPGLGGPAFGGPAAGLMHPQGMLGGGFDPAFMGPAAGYGGFSGPGFPGMLPSFPGVNAMGMAGVAPHVNPAFFGRGMGANGMGMMVSSGMDVHHAGMWGDTSMGGRGGEEQSRRSRESSYGGEDGGSEYGYGGENNEKSVRSSRDKERASEREWSGTTDRRRHDDRGSDRDRSEREHRYREDKEAYRDRYRERESGHDDDWDRGQSSSRSRSRSRAVPEDDHRSKSRDVDYGKRRRGD